MLEFVTRDEETDVFVTVKIQFYDGISVARFVTEVENRGAEEQTLEYVSLFNYTGIEKEGLLPRDEKMLVKVPHNSWQREMDWQTYTLPQLGLGQSQKTSEQRSSKAANFTNTGNWSTKEYLPMGYIENTETLLSAAPTSSSPTGSRHLKQGTGSPPFLRLWAFPTVLTAAWLSLPATAE